MIIKHSLSVRGQYPVLPIMIAICVHLKWTLWNEFCFWSYIWRDCLDSGIKFINDFKKRNTTSALRSSDAVIQLTARVQKINHDWQCVDSYRETYGLEQMQKKKDYTKMDGIKGTRMGMYFELLFKIADCLLKYIIMLQCTVWSLFLACERIIGCRESGVNKNEPFLCFFPFSFFFYSTPLVFHIYMLDHLVGKPSVNWKRTQVLLTLLFGYVCKNLWTFIRYWKSRYG